MTDAVIRRNGSELCRRCRRGSSVGIGPLLLGIALVVAPLVGLTEALLR